MVLANEEYVERFQPTLPRGERRSDRNVAAWTKYFNPRSRVGSDNFFSTVKKTNNNFNPRSRVGSDGRIFINRIFINISTHAPAWGATAKGSSIMNH